MERSSPFIDIPLTCSKPSLLGCSPRICADSGSALYRYHAMLAKKPLYPEDELDVLAVEDSETAPENVLKQV
ncbi:hypothetical protein DIPPA_06690 [Diplonema papillatum]|nr:hypothetical protein DIPPA_06690 [Diplonema papillatum]